MAGLSSWLGFQTPKANHERTVCRKRLVLESLESRAMLSAVSPLAGVVAHPLAEFAAASNPTPVGLTPAQIGSAYGFNQISFTNGKTTVPGDGAGQTIAIVDAYNDPNIVSDLKTFDAQFNLPAAKLTVAYPGGSTPATDAGWSTEIALDVEWAHAVAPGANILLVEAASDSLTDLLGAVNYAKGVTGVSVVSMSWGSSEFNGETSYDSTFTSPNNNVTFVGSAGDSAAPSIWPALSRNVLAVGGTTLNLSSGAYGSETGWSDSGGGYSRYETEPVFQSSITTVKLDGDRMAPDVAYDANPNTGVAVYDSVPGAGATGWMQIGGTSVGAPQWSALLAIADEGRALLTKPQPALGNAQALLYSLPSSDFHDVTSGNNGYRAGTGYDLVTGLGTPKANLVVASLVGLTNGAGSTTPISTGTGGGGGGTGGGGGGGGGGWGGGRGWGRFGGWGEYWTDINTADSPTALAPVAAPSSSALDLPSPAAVEPAASQPVDVAIVGASAADVVFAESAPVSLAIDAAGVEELSPLGPAMVDALWGIADLDTGFDCLPT